MKVKLVILSGMLLAAILPATAQTTGTPPSGSAPVSTDDGSYTPFAKGSFNINGSIGYTTQGTSTTTNLTPYSNKYDSTAVPNGKTSSFTIDLNPGYLVADNFQIGLVLDYTASSTLENNEVYGSNAYTNYSWNNTSNVFELGVAAIKYFPLGRNFYFKCTLGVDYITGGISSSSLQYIYNGITDIPEIVANPTESVSGFEAGFSPGLEYFPSKRWGINFNLKDLVRYVSEKVSNENPSYTNTAIVTSSQNITTSTLSIGAGLTPTIGVRYFF